MYHNTAHGQVVARAGGGARRSPPSDLPAPSATMGHGAAVLGIENGGRLSISEAFAHYPNKVPFSVVAVLICIIIKVEILLSIIQIAHKVLHSSKRCLSAHNKTLPVSLLFSKHNEARSFTKEQSGLASPPPPPPHAPLPPGARRRFPPLHLLLFLHVTCRQVSWLLR